MRKLKIIGGLLAVLGLLQAVAFAQEGLYFTPPQIDSLSGQKVVEAGANGTFQVHYKKTSGFSQATFSTGAMCYFNYDSAKIDNISFALNPAYLGHLSAPVNAANGNEYQVQIMAVSPDEGIDVGADILLGTVTFHVKQDYNLGGQPQVPWNIAWSANPDFVNISLYQSKGGVLLGKDSTKTESTDWQVEATHVPNFTGVGAVSDPQTGNTLNLNWSIANADANDLTDKAATYFTGGPGGSGLK
ncbi:MAG TPA: hypothetical protein VMT55_06235, partial [Candidatus Sulfotelmatobacter sp.]|nr:hypothetical protein [Candidatus Sulfotelmatobacter sp.]